MYLENKDPSFTYAAVPVRSPISGVLSQMHTSQMSKVNRGDKLFAVVNPKSLKLSAEFPSNDVMAVRSGLMGKFKIDPFDRPSLRRRPDAGTFALVSA